MLTPKEIQSRLGRVLPTVQKPGRYTGGELNQVVKDWDSIATKVALVFPDIYDLGMSNLGLAILYDLLNQREDVLAERAYVPWTDMEAAMRREEIPLYSLETKHPLADFDIIGISLPYETLYTSTLNALDLAGIPLFSAERGSEHPLVIAGGHSTFNPEPMHAHIDAFVIGEGEGAIQEIVDIVQTLKRGTFERPELLQALSRIWGVYVPSLYEAHYHEDGTFASIEKLDPEAPLPIDKRIEAALPPPTTRFIVPYVDTVHNRAPIEIMRGCTRGCRFCHAGMITRPVRERTVDEVLEAIEETIRHTGFEEIGLLSLSSSDYTHVVELVERVHERFGEEHLSVSLPSLRIESVSVNLMDALKGGRKGGFTLAPEAATEKMRKIINKPVSTEQLLETAREIYSRGWTTIKLYFMIGHPSETLEDVQAIVDLCKAVVAEGRKVIGGRAKLTAGVSTFVPKPHTPFQWVPCDSIEQIKAKQDLLKEELRGRGLKLNWNNPYETQLEAWLSRGDRRMAEVVYQAWKNGAKFDAWGEHFNYKAWTDAFETVGLDPAFYTHRHRPLDEVFPWEHLSTTLRKKFLTQDYMWSLEGRIRIDCREQCFACGILPAFAGLRRENPGDVWQCPEVSQGRVISIKDEDLLPVISGQ
ncbi:MAG: TIGR03960 family B12-binding radical SAM protein [Anaerolineales bacterium]|nr:TIGR03960 family B12-binding radical SAM protein [Chloroflexota bacterium]MBL6982519.1 TIGR03960 family B12-binding radical SAM protein [Anaerolineales bacterium]